MNPYLCPACHSSPNFPLTGNQLFCLSCKRVFGIRLVKGRLLAYRQGEIPVEIGPVGRERTQKPRIARAIGVSLLVLALLVVRRIFPH